MRKPKAVSHSRQKKIWDAEHLTPKVLKQMDSDKPSSGILKFWDWFKTNKIRSESNGIEMGCGKGRNVIWLAKQGVEMTGFDFSKAAIKEAKRRAYREKILNKAKFIIHDAIKAWPFKSNSFDLGIDCFATTDIETIKGRKFAVSELIRVVRSGGLILVYVLSIDDEYHREMIKKSPSDEKNAFLNPISGKFEKTFDRTEILSLYKDKVELIKEERIGKKEFFFGKSYKCKHYWMIFQKN
ncbi:MAG: class I SAM-dependent methyltransferase [Patescibacteria group bacterium]|nr:class I SAM-dependent methyltransferase [Patescibacteria group bacterium]